MNTQEKLEKLLLSKPEFIGARIKLLKDGYQGHAYSISSKAGKYVGHVAVDKVAKKFLGHTNTILLFLESKSIFCVPKSIFHDQRAGIHIETLVGTRDISFDKLNDGLLSLFAKCIATIHSFTKEQVDDFCRGNNLPLLPTLSAMDDMKVYAIDRFKIVKKLCPEKSIIEWIESRLDQNIALVQNQETENTYHLINGDLTDVRTDGKNIWIIDWEFGRLSRGSEISYLKIHTNISTKQLDHLVTTYAKLTNTTKEELLEDMKLEERVTRLNDVIWAAMKWGETNNNIMKVGRHKGLTYKELTHKRIKYYEDFLVRKL